MQKKETNCTKKKPRTGKKKHDKEPLFVVICFALPEISSLQSNVACDLRLGVGRDFFSLHNKNNQLQTHQVPHVAQGLEPCQKKVKRGKNERNKQKKKQKKEEKYVQKIVCYLLSSTLTSPLLILLIY
jgi:hypothetical protein